MNWSKAIIKIEAALAEGKEVELKYHRKWARNVNEFKWGMVENVVPYDWNGQICKAVNMHFDQLNEGTHIIDEINTWKEGK